MITDFAKNYIDAQHALEYSQAAGGAVFEVLLALLLAATTAGTGVAVNMASKARHVGEFRRVGRKLILLADALENSPRGIVRKRRKTTRVVEGRNSSRRRGRASQKSKEPELQAPTDKVAVLPAELAPNKTPPASDKKKPYSDPKNRPKYADDQVKAVWDNAKQQDGNVYAPNTGELLEWDKAISRAGQWDMGHKPGHEYRKSHKDYMDGKISKEEFLNSYRDPNNYQPEYPSTNRSHKYETK
ncbi:MAG: HNH/ENDO VII family nuclease [Gammaproteobacteria bacterium]|nr:HNH/ENDO VII family nuclease [Gammaproteobacteria bacterium]